jgi:hypothetical protein
LPEQDAGLCETSDLQASLAMSVSYKGTIVSLSPSIGLTLQFVNFSGIRFSISFAAWQQARLLMCHLTSTNHNQETTGRLGQRRTR